jgi:deoxyguanosine kinase
LLPQKETEDAGNGNELKIPPTRKVNTVWSERRGGDLAGYGALTKKSKSDKVRTSSFTLPAVLSSIRGTPVKENMLIAVEGCVGVGKTTVAKGLAAYRKCEVLLESFESNPFLSAFYEDPQKNATETEFTFLCLHFHQLRTSATGFSGREMVADFHLGKDLLYADLNLRDASTLRVFKELHVILSEKVPEPSVLVCLSASTQLVTERIRRRNRDFELKIDPGYYADLNAAYETLFEEYACKKVKICMDEWDFIESPEKYQRLSDLVDQQIGSKCVDRHQTR